MIVVGATYAPLVALIVPGEQLCPEIGVQATENPGDAVPQLVAVQVIVPPAPTMPLFAQETEHPRLNLCSVVAVMLLDL